MHRFISNQTDVRLGPNQSENSKYNLFSVYPTKIGGRFLFGVGALGMIYLVHGFLAVGQFAVKKNVSFG